MSLGSIVVSLSMRTADFETDAGRASKVAQRRAKEIDDAFRKAGTAIGLALGAGLVAAGAAMKSSIDRMDELSKAAQKVGMPTEEFSRLAYAGDLADVSMETLVGSLGKLTKAQAAALKETSEQAKVFDALNISATNADGSLRSSSEVLAEFADRFKAMEGSPEAMAAGFSLFGRSFQEMIPLLKDGAEGIRAAADESDRLGNTLSTEAGQAAEEFNDNLTRLQRGIGGVWMEIASGMLPQLNEMTGEMVSASKETDNLREFGSGLVTILQGLGSGFSFVAGMAKQFTIDTLALSDALGGYFEAAANIRTLGMAPGTVAGGMARASNAWDTRKGMLADIAAQRQRAEAQADIDRMLRNGVKYDGPLLEMGGPKGDQAAEYQKRLAKILGGQGGAKSSKAATPRKEELSEEAKEMQRLNEEAKRDLENMRERLGLMGLETEAAQMKWQTEEGAYKALEPLKKAELIAQAALVDAKEKALEDTRLQKQADEDAQKALEQVLGSIREEAETLGMTNEELETYNRLKWLGKEATDAMRESVIAESQAMQDARNAMGAQIEAMDAFRTEGSNFLQDIGNGEDPIDSFIGALDRLRAKLLQMIADNLMEQLFGQMGSAGGGSGGGWLASLAGMFGGLFGGGGGAAAAGGGSSMFDWIGNGYARGGWTGPGATNQPAGIVHADEVVWSKGDVARAGGVAQVESMRRGSAGVSSEAKRPLVVFNEAQMLDALAAHGGLEKVVVHYMERNRDRMRANAYD